jgi:hypothetical protein
MSPFRVRRRTFASAVPLLVAALAGCTREPTYAEVEGVVTLGGKPLDSVEVVFLPEPGSVPGGPQASAYTDAQGRYHLRTQGTGRDGAVVGRHRVCLHDLAALPSPGALPGPVEPDPTPAAPRPAGRPGPRRIPASYASASQTSLRDIQVQPGRQVLDFNLPGPK